MLTVAAIALGAGCGAFEQERPPNVLLIVVDTLRADRLSHYGHVRDTAAPLDSFRRQATLFTNAYAPSSWTTPSTASLLTGLVPARHRATRSGRVLNEEIRTLAETLRDHGWRTAGFSFNPNVTHATRFDQGFDHFVESSRRATRYPDINKMVQAAKSWIGAGEEPFFAYLQPMNVHGPYKTPKRFRHGFLGRDEDGPFQYYGSLMRAILRHGEVARRGEVSIAYVASLEGYYDAAVRYSAYWLDDLFEELRRLEQYESSLIIITSDHGEELFEHGGFSHGYSLYEEVLRVPLYVKLPGQDTAREIADRVSLTDVYPTVLAALGIEPQDIDGRSLLPQLEGKPEPVPERELLFDVDWRGRCVAQAMLSGPYKLISIDSNYEGLEDETLLFHIDRDPGETTNLADEEPERVRDLQRRMRSLRDAYAKRLIGPVPDDALEDMDTEALRALGYLE